MVITAAILFLGFKGIGYIRDTGSDVELANFVTDVRNGVQKNYNLNELSLTDANLIAPSETVLVCFLAPSENPNLSVIKDSILQKKISLLIKDKEENLYLVVKNEMTAYNIPNMKPKNSIQCRSRPSNIHLVFENKGDYTELEIK